MKTKLLYGSIYIEHCTQHGHAQNVSPLLTLPRDSPGTGKLVAEESTRQITELWSCLLLSNISGMGVGH